ncbi:MAG: MOSC domain-containing protein [Flavobacteriaceae bacterium]
MRVISTNLASSREILWKGNKISTGIYKSPVEGHIYLKSEHVENDLIADRKVHGGIHKACYLFSSQEYSYWKPLYPNLDWDWGMFGENLTVDGLDESAVFIGDIYKIGTAEVEVSQPREPCFKLGVRFGNQGILAQFIERSFPGFYVRILKEGKVSHGDPISLISRSPVELTIKEFFELLFSKEKNQEKLQMALSNEAIPERKRLKLKRYIKKGGL